MPDRMVLVLARDDTLASALRRMLGREGFPVRTADRLVAGTAEQWRGEDVSAVLVDAGLLAHDPPAELARVGSAFSGALVVVMAGRLDHPVLEAAVREGAVPMTADFDLEELVATLRGDDGLAGVREPRRPRPPLRSAGAVLQRPSPDP